VSIQFDHATLEPAPAFGAGDGPPSRRHPHLGMVLGDVTGPSSEFKVRKAVVVLDAVAVVNVVVGAESTPKMALHDVTMFEHVDASPGELNVSVPPDSSGDVLSTAAARAEAHMSSCSA
jgi:hypothetical protein